MYLFSIRLIGCLFLILVIQNTGTAITINVPGDYPSIQDAIDAASPSDTILVAPNTYVENINFLGKAITIISNDGPENTIIDGNTSGIVVTCNSSEGSDSIMEGFTITNGIAIAGAGMYNSYSNPTVINCIFSWNGSADYGGGMFNFGSNPTVTDCSFNYNYAGNDGGGMYCDYHSSPTVNNCSFEGNASALEGGGMFNHNYSHPSVNGCTFLNNSSDCGAGMYNVYGSNPDVIDCSFIENHATSLYGGGNGGGMFNTTNPLVENCLFRKNTADTNGGGMYNVGCTPIVTDCDFRNNSANGSATLTGGGAICNDNSNPEITNCLLRNNRANVAGGGILNIDCSNFTVADCIFKLNSTTTSTGGGGGMYNYYSNVIITSCLFDENTTDAVRGGGIYNNNCSPTVTFTIFEGNSAEGTSASSGGGGIYVFNGDPVIANCIFKENYSAMYGGGILYSACGGTVSNSTFYSNTAGVDCGGMYIWLSTPAVTNCIFWNDTPSEIYPIIGASITYCCVQGGYSGTGNISSAPRFADATAGDVHLRYTSPCKDTGLNSAATEPTDFEGDPRIVNGTVDMGADEFYTHFYVTGDKSPGGSIEGKFVGIPGTTPVYLFIGAAGVLSYPLTTMWGYFWLMSPWVYIGPLSSIPTNGIMVLPATLPASPPAPYDVPMQALIGLNPDSMSNLEILEVK